MKKISNRQVRGYVQNRQEFDANNIFARNGVIPPMSAPYPLERGSDRTSAYVVYSYGYHFPMYMELAGVWYRNTDKYSVTTSKHKGQAHPHADTVGVDTAWLKRVISGLVGYAWDEYVQARTMARDEAEKQGLFERCEERLAAVGLGMVEGVSK